LSKCEGLTSKSDTIYTNIQITWTKIGVKVGSVMIFSYTGSP